MKKWLVAGGVLLALVLTYVAAGPYLAIRGIHNCLENRQLGELHRFVDFPALRTNIQAQVDDRLLRAAGPNARGPLGQAAIGIISQVSDHAVDAMVSPQGIAILLEGRALARRVAGEPSDEAAKEARRREDPLLTADKGFESLSTFTATVRSAEDRPVVFVFTRHGLMWKLSDIRLPPEGLPG